MILQNILKYRNDSNFAHTFLSIIKSSHANPPEKKFFLIMLVLSIVYIFTSLEKKELTFRSLRSLKMAQ